MKTKARCILLSALSLIVGACGSKDAKDEQDLQVYAAKATACIQGSQKEFPFIARPFRTSELSFRVSGPIDHFDVYAGNRYNRGDVIAEINPRDFKIRKERAEGIYHQAKAEFERIQVLYRKENISASAYEKAQSEYISAKTAFETAVNELEDTRLTAPFNGYAGEVYIEKFQDVKAAQPVLSLIDIHQLRIEIYVAQDIACAARSLDSLQICFDALPHETYRAKIIEISKGTTRNNLSYLLTAMLPNEDCGLLAGMSGKAMLSIPPTESAAEVCIPQAALCHRPSEGTYVWVVTPAAQAERRKVTVSRFLPDGKARISTGLEEGEIIATSGLRFLSDGAKVTILTKRKNS